MFLHSPYLPNDIESFENMVDSDFADMLFAFLNGDAKGYAEGALFEFLSDRFKDSRLIDLQKRIERIDEKYRIGRTVGLNTRKGRNELNAIMLELKEINK